MSKEKDLSKDEQTEVDEVEASDGFVGRVPERDDIAVYLSRANDVSIVSRGKDPASETTIVVDQRSLPELIEILGEALEVIKQRKAKSTAIRKLRSL